MYLFNRVCSVKCVKNVSGVSQPLSILRGGEWMGKANVNEDRQYQGQDQKKINFCRKVLKTNENLDFRRYP